MANTSAIWQQAAHATYQLSSPSCSTWAIQKSLTLHKKYWKVFWKKSQVNGPLAEKWQDRKSKGTRQKKTREEIGKGNQMTAPRFQTVVRKAQELTDNLEVHRAADDLSTKFRTLNSLFSTVHCQLSRAKPIHPDCSTGIQNSMDEYMQFFRHSFKQHHSKTAHTRSSVCGLGSNMGLWTSLSWRTRWRGEPCHSE